MQCVLENGKVYVWSFNVTCWFLGGEKSIGLTGFGSFGGGMWWVGSPWPDNSGPELLENNDNVGHMLGCRCMPMQNLGVRKRCKLAWIATRVDISRDTIIDLSQYHSILAVLYYWNISKGIYPVTIPVIKKIK